MTEGDPDISFGYVSPGMDAIGFPLILYPHDQNSRFPEHSGPDFGNQVATYFMIKQENGFADER